MHALIPGLTVVPTLVSVCMRLRVQVADVKLMRQAEAELARRVAEERDMKRAADIATEQQRMGWMLLARAEMVRRGAAKAGCTHVRVCMGICVFAVGGQYLDGNTYRVCCITLSILSACATYLLAAPPACSTRVYASLPTLPPPLLKFLGLSLFGKVNIQCSHTAPPLIECRMQAIPT